MEARRRSTILLTILAIACFVIRWPLDNMICDPARWKYRPPAEEGETLTQAIFKGGGGTPAIFAMLGGQRYLVGNILWTYSDVLFHEQKPLEMLQPLEATVTLSPTFLEAWSVYGWHLAWNLNTYTHDVVMKEKFRRDGENIYLRAVATNPDRTRPYFDLAWLYIQRMGDYEKARKYLEAVVVTGVDTKKADGTTEHISFKPFSAKEAEDWSAGNTVMSEALERKWVPSVFANRLAYVYKKLGIVHNDPRYFEKAIETYEQYVLPNMPNKTPVDIANVKNIKHNISELRKNMHNAVWIKKQQDDEAKFRERYGMAKPSEIILDDTANQ
jgi:tetratricopeptide (TPR) repeat protein